MKFKNNLYKSEQALWRDDFDQYGFQWIDCNDTNNSVIVGTGLEKYKQANISNLADTLVIDENFRASSTFLSKVDLNFQKELISNQIPLVPFNSYSFGS